MSEITTPVDARAIEKAQREIGPDLEAALALAVTDRETDSIADAALSDFARRLDAFKSMRAEATGPLYQSAKTIEAWFRPLLADLEAAIAHLKTQRGRFAVALELERRKAEAEAAAALAAGSETFVESLQRATDASEKTAGVRGSSGTYWAPMSYDVSAIPREYLTPDTRKIEALAKAHKGATPPVIPGVVFERKARVGAKR